MDNISGTSSRLRATLLWVAVSVGGGAVALLSVPAITTTAAPGFSGLLVRGCAAAALIATLGLWAITTDVVLTVLRGRVHHGRRPVGPVRALLLATCGVVVLGAPASASGNASDPAPGWLATVVSAAAEAEEPGNPLDGLPMPQRPSAARTVPAPLGEPDAPRVVVRPGDSLWAIAEEHLPAGASLGAVASYTRALHDINADLIGTDPDLIHPGQHLELPQDGRNHDD